VKFVSAFLGLAPAAGIELVSRIHQLITYLKMRKMKLLLLTGMSAYAALMFAQTLPSTFPVKREGGISMVDHSKPEVARRSFHLNNKNYICAMTWPEAASVQAWQPSSPLPMSVDDTEEIARKELRKFASDEARWQLAEFSINRFPGNGRPIWYFAVTLKPALALGESNSDFFTMIVNSSGQPGQITATAPDREPSSVRNSQENR